MSIFIPDWLLLSLALVNVLSAGALLGYVLPEFYEDMQEAGPWTITWNVVLLIVYVVAAALMGW